MVFGKFKKERDKQLKTEIAWSDLIIEKGKLDPLGLWRVGDRLIAELLSPFTTIVFHRPARYFAMYTWIIYHLNNQGYEDRKKFWGRFFELEAVLLCAIQSHQNHTYVYFLGQIGGEGAKKFLSKSKNGTLDFSNIKIPNGWEHNYKMPMYDFNVIETDLGMPSGVKVTSAGKKIAIAYQNSIKSAQFYKKYLQETVISKQVIVDLSKFSCPCLLYKPQIKVFENERNIIIDNMLKKREIDSPNYIQEKLPTILSSIYLILHYISRLNSKGCPFTYQTFRHTLSTQVYNDSKIYSPPEEYREIFRRWELYNLDSLLVFSLESALAGFLEFLHKNNDNIKSSQLNTRIKDYLLTEMKKLRIEDLTLYSSLRKTFEPIAFLPALKLSDLEKRLIEEIRGQTSLRKTIFSFLLFVYVQALFIKKKVSPGYKNAMKFLHENSYRDGMELSLFQSISETENTSLEDFLTEIFFEKWIILRQLDTRSRRNKEIAWFSFNSETDTYNWESNYNPGLYRAARSEILMTFLLNFEIVTHKQDGWYLNRNSYFYKDVD